MVKKLIYSIIIVLNSSTLWSSPNLSSCVKNQKDIYQNVSGQINQYVEKYAGDFKHHPIANSILSKPLEDEFQFCTDADPAKAPNRWKLIDLMAKKSIKNSKYPFAGLPQILAGLIARCNHSEVAYKNAAFYLDYMYWNRILDKTGLEVSEALAIRDIFYHGVNLQKSIKTAHNQLTAIFNLDTGNYPNPHEKDFITADVMSKTKVLKYFGKAINVLDETKLKIIDDVADELDLRENTYVIFGKKILEVLNDPKDLKFMNDVSVYITELQKNPKLLGKKNGGWHKFLELAGGDRERVIRVIGILASMRFWEIDDIGNALAKRGELSCEKMQALYQGANAYFFLNQLDEKSALDHPDGTHVSYQFFYPPEYSTTDWKIYHWYSNAYLGCQLAKKGNRIKAITYGVKSLAESYEYVSLFLASPSRALMGVDPKYQPIIEGSADVQINTEGAIYGGTLCQIKK